MMPFKTLLQLSLWALFSTSLNHAEERLVTLGGPITELVYALGAGEAVVAADSSSQAPAAARALPKVGYVAAVAPEGVLSVEPTHILATTRLGPPSSVERLRASGVPLTLIPNPNSAESLQAAIAELGQLLDRTEAAATLWERIAADLEQARAYAEGRDSPRVVFLLGSDGVAMAAGDDTQASGIVTLAGGRNLFLGHRSYKPVSEEAVLGAEPEVILIATHRALEPGADLDPAAALQEMGLGRLQGASSARVYLLDMTEYLSFGPRTGAAALKLAQLLHEGSE